MESKETKEIIINNLKDRLAWLKANPGKDTYTGWNSLADCRCKESEEIYIKLMLLEINK